MSSYTKCTIWQYSLLIIESDGLTSNASPYFDTQQVVSDKVLVKQLQKEVARLEAELKLPEGGMESSSSEALLQAKDLQIQKVCFCLHIILVPECHGSRSANRYWHM